MKKYFICFLLLTGILGVNNSSAQNIKFGEQKFTVQNLIIKNHQFKNGVAGIQLFFDIKALYNNNEIIWNAADSNNKSFYLYLVIKDNDKNLFHPEMGPIDIIGYVPTTNYYCPLFASNKNIFKQFSFFIPYYHFDLSAGNHLALLELNACNQNKTIIINQVFEKQINIEMPRLCRNVLNITDLKIKDGDNYDIAARNIPFVSLFYSNKSKSGYGYPDVYWAVNIGNDVVFKSKVNRDDFEGVAAEISFFSFVQDPIALYVWDEDSPNWWPNDDDLLGSWALKGNYFSIKQLTNATKDDVEKISFNYIKEPAFNIKNNLKIEKHINRYGMRGMLISFCYYLDQASDYYPIVLRPIISIGSQKLHLILLSKKLDVKGNLSEFKINGANSNGRVELFIPDIFFMNNSELVVSVSMLEYNNEVTKTCYLPFQNTIQNETGFTFPGFSKYSTILASSQPVLCNESLELYCMPIHENR
jgi:hypothetical protein